MSSSLNLETSILNFLDAPAHQLINSHALYLTTLKFAKVDNRLRLGVSQRSVCLLRFYFWKLRLLVLDFAGWTASIIGNFENLSKARGWTLQLGWNTIGSVFNIKSSRQLKGNKFICLRFSIRSALVILPQEDCRRWIHELFNIAILHSSFQTRPARRSIHQFGVSIYRKSWCCFLRPCTHRVLLTASWVMDCACFGHTGPAGVVCLYSRWCYVIILEFPTGGSSSCRQLFSFRVHNLKWLFSGFDHVAEQSLTPSFSLSSACLLVGLYVPVSIFFVVLCSCLCMHGN